MACHLSATKKLVRQSLISLRTGHLIASPGQFGQVSGFARIEETVPGKFEQPEVVRADDIGAAVLAGAEAELQGVIPGREGELVAETVITTDAPLEHRADRSDSRDAAARSRSPAGRARQGR